MTVDILCECYHINCFQFLIDWCKGGYQTKSETRHWRIHCIVKKLCYPLLDLLTTRKKIDRVNESFSFLVSLKICRIYFGSWETKTSSKMRVVRTQSVNAWIDGMLLDFFRILTRIAEMWFFNFRKQKTKWNCVSRVVSNKSFCCMNFLLLYLTELQFLSNFVVFELLFQKLSKLYQIQTPLSDKRCTITKKKECETKEGTSESIGISIPSKWLENGINEARIIRHRSTTFCGCLSSFWMIFLISKR